MGMKRHKRQYVVLKKKVIKPQYVAAPRANDSHPMLCSDSGRQLTLGSLTTTTPTHNSRHCQHCLCKTTPNQAAVLQYTSIPLIEELQGSRKSNRIAARNQEAQKSECHAKPLQRSAILHSDCILMILKSAPLLGKHQRRKKFDSHHITIPKTVVLNFLTSISFAHVLVIRKAK